jgi:uncharacterized membrane protein
VDEREAVAQQMAEWLEAYAFNIDTSYHLKQALEALRQELDEDDD